MTQKLFAREHLLSEFRTRRADHDYETIDKRLRDQYQAQEWELERENKSTLRMKRPKSQAKHLEDRVWTLLYLMGFEHLSGKNGLILPSSNSSSTGKGGQNQLDVVGLDGEAAVAIECKSSKQSARRTNFQGELGKFSILRDRFTKFARDFGETRSKRAIGMVMVLDNVILSAAERDRARESKVALIDGLDLQYYEDLTKHLGLAARYQFLADIFGTREVPELSTTVPAIRSKMGKETAYTFSMSPEYLLKIAYVSHRAKGKASDVDTYQRMVKKSRLNAIRQYIQEESNVFPTNIVVSLDCKTRFDLARQEGDGKDDLGWLHLEPSYKSAWIIDGQHRLFAYSGLDRARSSRLNVLAFEKLSPSMQAQLFIDINAEQKAVKKDLLHELFAELHWNSEDVPSRTKAVITKAIQTLDQEPDSPFHSRIIAAEGGRSPQRCISLTTFFRALHQPELYMGTARRGKVEKPGIMWAADNDTMLRRTVALLKSWFGTISELNQHWWDLGSEPGGGLSMNDSIAAHVMVLRSVCESLADSGTAVVNLDDDEAAGKLQPFARIVGDFLAGYDAEQRLQYREGRGIQGQTIRMRRMQAAIKEHVPSFNPAGLEKFLKEEAAETNISSKRLIDEIETLIQEVVISELKRHFGEENNAWWTDGVPRATRVSAAKLQEEDDDARRGAHFYLNLIDYRKIVTENWLLFESVFAFEKSGNKEKRTAWMATLNDIRKIVSHASSGRTVSLEQLEQLQGYVETFKERLDHAEA